MTNTRIRGSAPPALLIKILRVVVAAFIVVVALVVLARWLRTVPSVESFIDRYPGTSKVEGAPIGVPAWTGVLHFLNMLFLMLLIRTGISMRRGARPPAHWTRRNSGKFRGKRPPQRISLTLWLHLTVDALWILTGVVFYALLFSTGRWLRLVPTSIDVFPQAASVLLQYISLAWPVENGWIAYNALQMGAYTSIIFVAAPLAILSGMRLSPVWPPSFSTWPPLAIVRQVHFGTMVYFVGFTVVHVLLVAATGVRRNLNHMFAIRDDGGWLGVIMFALAVAMLCGIWIAARPVLLRSVASLTGKVSH